MGGCRRAWRSIIMPNSGQTKFCRLLARHMNGCNSSMYTRNRKKIASWLQAKRTKNLSQIAWITARGQHRSSAKNYTKPVGVSPIYWRRFLDDQRRRGIELTRLDWKTKSRRNFFCRDTLLFRPKRSRVEKSLTVCALPNV